MKIDELTEHDTQVHLDALCTAFFENIEFDGSCEFGSIGLDCKRPFGNSCVEIDIMHIIGLHDSYSEIYDDDDQREEYDRYARELYCEKLLPYLKKKWFRYYSNCD